MKARLIAVVVLALLLVLVMGFGLRVAAQGAPSSVPSLGSPDRATAVELSGADTSATVATAVVVSGTTAYVGFDTQLHIVDVLDPTDPAPVSVIGLTASRISDLWVAGDLLYAANSEAGLRVISVTVPTAPAEIGYTVALTPVTSVVVQGDYIYTGGADVGVFSRIDPSSPALVGSLTGWGYNVDVSGAYAYQAGTGLRVYSVADPTAITLVGSVATTMAYHVDVQGQSAYLADYMGGLKVISVADPANPTIVGSASTSGYASRVAVAGPHAYVCSQTYGLDGTGYLQDFSVSDPAAPVAVAERYLPGGCNDLVVKDAYIYLAGADGLLILTKSGLNVVGSYPVSSVVVPPDAVSIVGPTAGTTGVSYAFTATVYPITATTPITWLWQATDQAPVTRAGDITDVLSYTWDTPGMKTITVTATNAGGLAVAAISVPISMPAGDHAVYLPLVQRNAGALCSAVPTLISPADGSRLDTLTPLFE